MRFPALYLTALLVSATTSCADISSSLTYSRIGIFTLSTTGAITTTRMGGAQVTRTTSGTTQFWQTQAYTGDTGAELGEWDMALIWQGNRRPVAGQAYNVVWYNDAPSDTTRFGMLLADVRVVNGDGIVKAWRITSGTMLVDSSTSDELKGRLTFTAVEVTQPSSATISGSATIDAPCATGHLVTAGSC